MEIEFIEYIGEIKNDTDINGKAYIFEILDLEKKYKFECILFLHPNNNFVSLNKEDIDLGYNKEELLNEILKKYNKGELLQL